MAEMNDSERDSRPSTANGPARREAGEAIAGKGGTATAQSASGPAPAAGVAAREAERAERLAAALRANLSRRKAARRAGLDDFGRPGDAEDEGGGA